MKLPSATNPRSLSALVLEETEEERALLAPPVERGVEHEIFPVPAQEIAAPAM